ncbi:MAG TPA: hypothetical protein VNM67_18315 [Thermoanaerobaculia bacterium]|jgi:hypothetical protein|nr:hypothetical protein [Thermoanaerobaculia bacterium]
MTSNVGSLDHHLPAYRHREVHEVTVAAGPKEVMRAIRELKGREVALARPLFALRSLPAWLLRCPVRTSHPDQRVVDVILEGGFTLLDEGPLEMVVGVIGRFWQLSASTVPLAGPADFAAFDRDGYAKGIMNFTVEPLGPGQTRLRTETRVLPLGREAARKFRLYWLFVRPGSGLIRWIWLAAIKKRAEKGVP